MLSLRSLLSQPVPRWRLALGLILLVGLLGVCGYMLLVPGISFFHALYMTVITLSMVGFHDQALEDLTNPALETPLRIFTMCLIFFGVGSVAYAFSVFFRALVEGELREMIGTRRTKRRLFFMKDHYIVCGYGRMGGIIAETLAQEGIPVVVIEVEPARRREIESLGAICLIGDATNDELLHEAAIEDARGLIAVTNSDPENLFVTLSARQINPKLNIVARALSPDAERKLLRAGANRVVLPYKLGAHQLAQAALRPNVVDFMEIAARTSKIDIELEEVTVTPGSTLADKKLQEATILSELGLIVIGIRSAGDSELQFKPSAETKIHAHDTLIVLGDPTSLDRLRSAAN